MNKAILNNDVQNFIYENLNSDLNKLVFKISPFPEVSMAEIIQQIEGKLKAKDKLPSWFNTKNIYYPPKVNLEQTSSEVTANYKSQLVSGNSLADLTGGFGIDVFYFSKKIKSVLHCELNQTLSEIVFHNFKQLNQYIDCVNKDGIEAISEKSFDVIYLDPSRRHDVKGKVFLLSDCEPDVTKHLDYLLQRCKTLLIKTSPMFDISAGLKELNWVAAIHIVAVENEVKELLWLLKSNINKEIQVTAVNITKNQQQLFTTTYKPEENLEYVNPKKYLFEPNTAVMKSGMFQAVANQMNVEKLAKNTHLFTSDQLVEFPGRSFEIEKILPYNKAVLKNEITGIKANVSIRNFPESVAVLKSKWKIIDGGKNYLFFITDNKKNKLVLFCKKLKI